MGGLCCARNSCSRCSGLIYVWTAHCGKFVYKVGVEALSVSGWKGENTDRQWIWVDEGLPTPPSLRPRLLLQEVCRRSLNSRQEAKRASPTAPLRWPWPAHRTNGFTHGGCGGRPATARPLRPSAISPTRARRWPTCASGKCVSWRLQRRPPPSSELRCATFPCSHARLHVRRGPGLLGLLGQIRRPPGWTPVMEGGRTPPRAWRGRESAHGPVLKHWPNSEASAHEEAARHGTGPRRPSRQ